MIIKIYSFQKNKNMKNILKLYGYSCHNLFFNKEGKTDGSKKNSNLFLNEGMFKLRVNTDLKKMIGQLNEDKKSEIIPGVLLYINLRQPPSNINGYMSLEDSP